LTDEHTHYCQAPIVFAVDTIKWQLEPTQQKTFPNLSKMTLDCLSISGTSTEIQTQEIDLEASTMEALGCWLRIHDKGAELIQSIREETTVKSLAEGAIFRLDFDVIYDIVHVFMV
jgi:hypothetical protein